MPPRSTVRDEPRPAIGQASPASHPTDGLARPAEHPTTKLSLRELHCARRARLELVGSGPSPFLALLPSRVFGQRLPFVPRGAAREQAFAGFQTILRVGCE